MSDDAVTDAGPSTYIVACEPWVFTQRSPLTTDSFIREADRRGVALDEGMLRELYRHRVLAPFVQITGRRRHPRLKHADGQPPVRGTVLGEIRRGAERGCLVDPTALPTQPKLRFDSRRRTDPSNWWNGLVYAHCQLPILTVISAYIAQRRRQVRGTEAVVRLPKPDLGVQMLAARYRRIAALATAIEARYLPNLDPEWLRLHGVVGDEEELWEQYRARFDPAEVSARLAYSADEVRKDAESLLLRADRIDPIQGPLRQLIHRTPPDKWKDLRGSAMSAMDLREVAELLLRFYEDLAARGVVTPLPDPKSFGMSWHPLLERISYRDQTLDEDLMDLGLSPHPRVILALEGETETLHAPLVWTTLGFPEAPELVRVLMIEGVQRDLVKVAALAAAPIVRGQLPGHDAWQLIKPPTRLLVAVDPEGKQFGSTEKVSKTRKKLIEEIRNVLRAQGVERPNFAELDELVDIRTWSASCYEFTHFTDGELADAVLEIDGGVNCTDRPQLVQALEAARKRHKDIKEVWGRWVHKPSKTKLAAVLWPHLEARIAKCRVDADAPVPEVARVMQSAYHLAQQWRYLSFVLGEEKPRPPEVRQ